MSFCFGISAIVAVDSYCFFTSFVAAYDGITTARVTITISSFRRQNTRKRSLRVTSPFSQSEGPRAGSGAPNNTLRTVKPCRILMAAQPMDGGVARHVVSLVEALPRERFTVDVACPRGSLTWASLEGAAGVELHAIGSHRRPELYRVIPNGVDLARFSLPREPVRGRILTVGRLAPPKRPDLALRALAQVRERIPEAELWVVGDGPLRADAERLAGELGVTEATRFVGHRDDVPELLATAECVLLASDYEGCPLSVVEAMAAGLGVAATDAGG